jgi:iron(III) transport system ATP-binding protein
MPMSDGMDEGGGLVVEDVRHAYGSREVVKGVSLSIPTREILCILGPSGCGKTSLLRIIAGLEELQYGRVMVDGEIMAGDGIDIPPEDRSMSLLFQDFALFPHLSVIDNVTFGLTHLSPEERDKRAREVLEQVGMLGYLDSFPHVLSGGEQQRIALARARAPRPQVMLLDEPFSNLDVRLRSQLRDLVLHVLKQSSAATLIVTHDPEEAMFMGDRIAVMRDGVIVQEGTPEDLYHAPVDTFVAGLFSEVNRIPGVVLGNMVETVLGPVPAPGFADGAKIVVLVRPESLGIIGPDGSGPAATVVTARMLGQSSLIHLSVEQPGGAGLHLHIRTMAHVRPAEGDTIGIHFDPDRAFVFPDDSDD